MAHILSKSALSATGIPGFDYCLNPYVGCRHGCKYCYASFMKRFTGHKEPWGEFLDVKINIPELLERETSRKKKGPIIVGSVTDPYQPAEGRYKLARRCLEVLAEAGWPVSILTKSSRVLRDIDVLHAIEKVKVGVTITTDSESIRRIFEPGAPPLKQRMRALDELRAAGIETFAFVGPMLPMNNPDRLAAKLGQITDTVLMDRMNYIGRIRSLYRAKGLLDNLEPEYFDLVETSFKRELGEIVQLV